MCQLKVLTIYIQGDTKKGTFEMHSGSHVQLAALRNRDLELQTTSPFSDHGSVERQVVMVQFLSIKLFCWISTIFVGFFKSSLFCVTLYIYDLIVTSQRHVSA
jgi:hypothetical protein